MAVPELECDHKSIVAAHEYSNYLWMADWIDADTIICTKCNMKVKV